MKQVLESVGAALLVGGPQSGKSSTVKVYCQTMRELGYRVECRKVGLHKCYRLVNYFLKDVL